MVFSFKKNASILRVQLEIVALGTKLSVEGARAGDLEPLGAQLQD